MMESYDNLIKKWSPVLNEESAGKSQTLTVVQLLLPY
jgi:hypothetical protein